MKKDGIELPILAAASMWYHYLPFQIVSSRQLCKLQL